MMICRAAGALTARLVSCMLETMMKTQRARKKHSYLPPPLHLCSIIGGDASFSPNNPDIYRQRVHLSYPAPCPVRPGIAHAGPRGAFRPLGLVRAAPHEGFVPLGLARAKAHGAPGAPGFIRALPHGALGLLWRGRAHPNVEITSHTEARRTMRREIISIRRESA